MEADNIPEGSLTFRFSILLAQFFKDRIKEVESHLEEEIEQRFILSGIYSLGFINGDTQLLQKVGLGDLETVLSGKVTEEILKEIFTRPIIKVMTSWLCYAIKNYQKDRNPKWLYPKDPLELLKVEKYKSLKELNLN